MTTRATNLKLPSVSRGGFRGRMLTVLGGQSSIALVPRRRLHRAVRELVRQLPVEDLQAAASEPTDVEALATALIRAQTSGTRGMDPRVLEAQVRGRAVKERLLRAEGGCAAAGVFAGLLNVSRQAIDKQRLAGRLIAIRDREGGPWLYPLWQLKDGSGSLVKGLDSVLQVLTDAGHEGWAILLFFLETEVGAEEASRTPLAALRAGDVDATVRAAKQYGEQGAL